MTFIEFLQLFGDVGPEAAMTIQLLVSVAVVMVLAFPWIAIAIWKGKEYEEIPGDDEKTKLRFARYRWFMWPCIGLFFLGMFGGFALVVPWTSSSLTYFSKCSTVTATSASSSATISMPSMLDSDEQELVDTFLGDSPINIVICQSRPHVNAPLDEPYILKITFDSADSIIRKAN